MPHLGVITMLRRELLAGVAALAAPDAVFAGAPSRKRVRPGEAGWPTEAEWSELGQAVGGRLSRPVSMLAPCQAAPKSDACNALLKDLQNPFFIQDQPSGAEVSGYLDAWTPEPSAYVVAARSAADVAAAVRFARTHDLRLVVKGGGHSYLGGSNAPDSLLVWTHAMRNIQLHDAFVPAGCEARVPPEPAVSLGAGCRWIEAYDAVTTKAGRYVQGGGCTSVGVAGLIQGGGFGSFSKRYGMGASNLLEAEIVTADGAVRVVNVRRDPDLFWALKGGGGGTFGVVTRVTVKTHKAPTIGGGFGLTITAKSDEAFRRLIGAFVDLYADRLCNPNWGEQVSLGRNNVLKANMVTLDLDDEAATAAWRPLLDAVAASGGDWTLTQAPDVGNLPFRKWWDTARRRARTSDAMRYDERPGAPEIQAWWSGDSQQVSMLIHGYESIWLPESLLRPADRPRLADALFAASRRFGVSLHFNKGLAGGAVGVRDAARATATNPDVADAFALAIIATGGPPAFYSLLGLPSGVERARADAEAIRLSASALRAACPGAGAYISEASYFQPDWRRAFWGPNYPKLRGVKAKYDPTGLFFVHHGVGSEDWSADGFTRVA